MYFGQTYASEIAGLYKDFFNAYWSQKRADIAGFERQYIFQDIRWPGGRNDPGGYGEGSRGLF